jgi:hypothetical protein
MKMKARTTTFLIFAFCLLPFAFPQDPPAAKPPVSVGAPPAAPAAKPVALDPEFEELYGDYALLLQEIDRLESATGQVVITLPLRELRGRALAKEKKMQAWVEAHKVGRGWVLDWQKKEFHEPEKKAEVGSRQSEVGSRGAEKAKSRAAAQASPSEDKK